MKNYGPMVIVAFIVSGISSTAVYVAMNDRIERLQNELTAYTDQKVKETSDENFRSVNAAIGRSNSEIDTLRYNQNR